MKNTDYYEKKVERVAVEKRIVIVHNPFTEKKNPPFDIEEEIYTEWARLLKENIKPDLMLTAHKHICGVYPIGGELDGYGQPCTMVVGAKPEGQEFTGCGLIFTDKDIKVSFTKSTGEMSELYDIDKN
mgnify:CR=1 FL=1